MTEPNIQKTEIEHIQGLLETHKQNLYTLEEKKARFGINAQPDLIHAIHYEQEEIEKLEARMRVLRSGVGTAVEYDLGTIRQVINQVSQYIVKMQRPEGIWLRNDLYPTARILYSLFAFSSEVDDTVLQRSVDWVKVHLENPQEKSDAVAMGLIALIEAKKRLGGVDEAIESSIERIVKSQKKDGSWEGRYPIDRYYGASTATCVQALRAYSNAFGTESCQAACYDGVHYLERYFRSLDLFTCIYSDVINPVVTLLLPHYEAWEITDFIPEIHKATQIFKGKLKQYRERGNIKAVSGVLALLLTEWRNFDETTIQELLSWLIRVRNTDYGWTEYVDDQSEPHHSAMIALPIRQLERLGDHYIPIVVNDYWSMPGKISTFQHESSTGAVIFRKLFGKIEIVLLRRHDGNWVLPKGHIEPGETPEVALTREIKEETGFTEVSVLENIGSYNYLFRINNDQVNKNVVYYLVKSNNTKMMPIPDEAHADARWFPIQDIHLLPIYYDDCREAILSARQLLSEKENL